MSRVSQKHPLDAAGFLRTILSDLAAVLATFAVILITTGLSALSHHEV